MQMTRPRPTTPQLMHGDPICLDERDFPARINEVLKECDGYPFKHQAFPVVQHTDPEGQLRRGKTRTLRGVISRKQLVQMLANNQAQLELHPSLGIQEGETIESSPVSLLPCTIPPIDTTFAGRDEPRSLTFSVCLMCRHESVAVHGVAERVDFVGLSAVPSPRPPLAYRRYARTCDCAEAMCRVVCWLMWVWCCVCCSG